MLVLSYFMPELLIETHPFPAIFPAHAKVMMMGTFPPKEDKRCMHFHYPNFQNDMWRIYGLVFFDDATYFQIPDEKRFDPAKIEMFYVNVVLHYVLRYNVPFVKKRMLPISF
ncbi:hypothetical protein AAUPMB_07992 [Pasteurella multocida subsp. multocida str. Anand1_buffalo]|nr:hypothetical protein AAUPMB_07992 [Pasteurella multocida subsp. multocida str. Anand1_buffalo]